MGIDTTLMQREAAAIDQEGAGSGASVGKRPTASGFTGNWGWNEFYVAADSGANCDGNKVRDSGHCGWLYNHFTVYTQGVPKTTYTTVFEARSGDLDPSHDWMPNVGPLPNADWESSRPSLGRFHWGWKQGQFAGYTASTDESYSPGYWPLDPWDVYSGASYSGTHRGAFMIHGGTGSHYYTVSRTWGCIRLRSEAVPSLRSLWANYTDNKRNAPGPDQYVLYRAP
jgi:hypothetical protein